MCKFIGKSNKRILCKLNKSEILRLYSIVHVAMETTKTSNFTCQSKFFISIFFTCQVSVLVLELQFLYLNEVVIYSFMTVINVVGLSYMQTSLQHAIILFFVYPEIFPNMVEFIVKVQNFVCKISPLNQIDLRDFY